MRSAGRHQRPWKNATVPWKKNTDRRCGPRQLYVTSVAAGARCYSCTDCTRVPRSCCYLPDIAVVPAAGRLCSVRKKTNETRAFTLKCLCKITERTKLNGLLPGGKSPVIFGVRPRYSRTPVSRALITLLITECKQTICIRWSSFAVPSTIRIRRRHSVRHRVKISILLSHDTLFRCCFCYCFCRVHLSSVRFKTL